MKRRNNLLKQVEGECALYVSILYIALVSRTWMKWISILLKYVEVLYRVYLYSMTEDNRLGLKGIKAER